MIEDTPFGSLIELSCDDKVYQGRFIYYESRYLGAYYGGFYQPASSLHGLTRDFINKIAIFNEQDKRICIYTLQRTDTVKIIKLCQLID